MDAIDLKRMDRVLGRVYPDRPAPPLPPPPPGPPPPGEETIGLLVRERELRTLLRELFFRCVRCRRTLGPALDHNRRRLERLTREHYLQTGKQPPPPPPGKPRWRGVYAALRQVWQTEEELSRAYETAGERDPRRREEYAAMSRECRAAARRVRDLLT